MSKFKTKKWTLLYKEISKLGEGGNADVYIVEDNESGSKYALKELDKIEKDSIVYEEAKRLKSFLGFFREVEKNIVPENSILREFIGGSIFYKY